MFGNVTALQGLHETGKYRGRSKQHTCCRHAAWDSQPSYSAASATVISILVDAADIYHFAFSDLSFCVYWFIFLWLLALDFLFRD